ncbi:MAG: hypothetical protein RL094_448 [Candidatus Parcubacteria bacterium]|jgi:hypothetical protein
MESKYNFKRNSPSQIVIYSVFGVLTLILILVWMVLRSINPELAFVSNIFVPIMIFFGIAGFLMQIFVVSKRQFIKLTDTSVMVYRGLGIIPNTFKYIDIKRVNISGEMLKGIDTGLYAAWPIFLNVENVQQFVQDLSLRYKSSTGTDIVIY